MDSVILGRDELVTGRLRRLFEQRGFKRVSVNKFEDYALYIDNKNFLQSENIITFMDMDGKLLALKPDVTLSVVKNMPRQPLPVSEKLYYVDEVYRLSRENREYKVHSQIGVELVGETDGFASIEVIDLALDSLAAISDSFVLDISHLGFVSGLLEDIGLSHRCKLQLLAGIHAKSTHEVGAILAQAGVAEQDKNRILALSALHGSFVEALPQAKALITGEAMSEAYRELEQVGAVLGDYSHHVKLDFSVVNNLDYYNGLIFLGYVQEVPKVVLTGGRYDNLLHKMGKQSGAIGFAVSLDELNTYFKSGRKYDFDILLTYPEDCGWAALLAYVKQLIAQGSTVRLERESSDISAAGFTYATHIRYSGKPDGEGAQSC